MPDPSDGTVAPDATGSTHNNKRNSASIAVVTVGADAGSESKHELCATIATPTADPSPKKRRKVNHGQDMNSHSSLDLGIHGTDLAA
jgi:hypothetical protein